MSLWDIFRKKPVAGKRWGWVPDHPDHRDHDYRYALMAPTIEPPKMVDWRKRCPPVYNQGILGSCTGNGIAGACEVDMVKQGGKSWTPARLFIYYNERVIEGSVNQDAGAMIRDGIKSVVKQGVPPETMWPYVVGKYAKKPSLTAYAEALRHRVSSYHRVDNTNLNEMKTCIAQGNTIVFGMSVFESFESSAVAKTGIVPMPAKNESMVGGHCMLIVGYDETHWIARNSWGEEWGLAGYCRIPHAYLTNAGLADDFWTILAIPA